MKLVNYQEARSLKKLGYSWLRSKMCYSEGGSKLGKFSDLLGPDLVYWGNDDLYVAPSLEDTLEWILKEYKICIYYVPKGDKDFVSFSLDYKTGEKRELGKGETPEEALHTGLSLILKELLE